MIPQQASSRGRTLLPWCITRRQLWLWHSIKLDLFQKPVISRTFRNAENYLSSCKVVWEHCSTIRWRRIVNNKIIGRSFNGGVAAKEWDSLIQSEYKQKDRGRYYCAGKLLWPLQNRKAFLLGFVLKQAWLCCLCNRNPPWEEELEEEKRVFFFFSV